MTEGLPDPLAVFPLQGAVLLPDARMPLNIFEPRYLKMVEDALTGQKMIGMIQPLKPETPGHVPELYQTGCIGEIIEHRATDDGRILINLEGRQRFLVVDELDVATPYRQIHPDYDAYKSDCELYAVARETDQNDSDALRASIERFLNARSLSFDWSRIDGLGAGSLINLLIMLLPLGAAEKQAVLEAKDARSRVEMMVTLIDMMAADTGSGDLDRLQ